MKKKQVNMDMCDYCQKQREQEKRKEEGKGHLNADGCCCMVKGLEEGLFVYTCNLHCSCPGGKYAPEDLHKWKHHPFPFVPSSN